MVTAAYPHKNSIRAYFPFFGKTKLGDRRYYQPRIMVLRLFKIYRYLGDDILSLSIFLTALRARHTRFVDPSFA